MKEMMEIAFAKKDTREAEAEAEEEAAALLEISRKWIQWLRRRKGSPK